MHADAFSYILWHFLMHSQSNGTISTTEAAAASAVKMNMLCAVCVTWWIANLFIDQIDLYVIKFLH